VLFLKLKGLKARLLAIVLLAMLPVLCIALFLAVDDYRSAKSGAVENSRRLTVTYAATGNAFIERARLLMLHISNMPGVKPFDAESCRRITAALAAQGTIARGASIYGTDGRLLCSAGIAPGARHVSPARTGWFKEALRTRNFVIGRYQATADGAGELPLALPLAGPDGMPRVVLCLTFDLNNFAEFLDDQELPKGASSSVIDSGGTILARFPWSAAAVGKSAPEAEGFLPDLRFQGRDTWEAVGVDGVPRIYFLSHLAGSGDQSLFLRVGMPAEAVFSTAKRNLARNLAFIGLMTAVVLFSTWFFSHSLVLRHIKKIWLATSKLSEGNYGYRIGAAGGGELGELALAFDQMAGVLEDRTARLTDAELKYREIFENSAAGIFRATPDGRIRDANRTMAALLGYSEPRELMEQVRDIGQDLYAEPEQRKAVLARLNQEGSISCLEFPAKRADGGLVWLSMEARAVRTAEGLVACYGGMVSDISKRREMEQELRAKQEKLQALLEYSPTLICIKDKTGRYLLANRRHEEVRSGGRSMVGKHVRDIFPAEVARRILDEDALVLAEGKPMTYQRPLADGDGARHYVTVKFPLRDQEGSPDRVGSISYDITDLERVREALRRSEEKFRIMIQTSPDLIWLIDPKGVLVEVNSASRDLIGFEPEELRGRHFHQFFHPDDLRNHDRDLVLPLFHGRSPKDGQHPKLINERRQMPRSTRNLSLRLLTREGEARHFELSSCGLWQDMRFMGTIVVIRDISERRHAEAALRQNRELLRQTQSIARVGGWSLNLDTRERGWTEEANRLLGLADGQMPDFAVEQDFLASEERPTLREALLRAEETGADFNLELRLAPSGGPQRWVRVIGRRADAEGARLLSGVIQDISDRKELERLRADIDSIIRHDLKAPLNGIINLPQLMKHDENLTPAQAEYLQLIEDSGRSMLRQIDMSLDLMKIELGTYVCAPDYCDLASTLREALGALRDAADAQGVGLEATVDGLPLTAESVFLVWGEERLCHPILSNLLVNALEASPAGERVSIRLEQGECARVIIRNKGEVPEALRERFFEKYATSGKTAGTGLGTYSAQLFAEAQRGCVELDASEPGATTIVVRLPRPKRDA